jgi:hypothetical protein
MAPPLHRARGAIGVRFAESPCCRTRTLQLTWPSVAALPQDHAAERQSLDRQSDLRRAQASIAPCASTRERQRTMCARLPVASVPYRQKTLSKVAILRDCPEQSASSDRCGQVLRQSCRFARVGVRRQPRSRPSLAHSSCRLVNAVGMLAGRSLTRSSPMLRRSLAT